MQNSSIFLGVTTSPARDIIADIFVDSEKVRYFLPCVGRFTVPLVMRAKGIQAGKIWTSDIGLFSSMIGYLADPEKDFDALGVELPEKFYETVGAAGVDANDPRDLSATVMLWMKVSQSTETHAFGRAMRKEILKNWSVKKAGVRKKLDQMVDALEGIHYDTADVWDVARADAEDEDVGLYVNVPTYKGGYVKMFQAANVRWNEPVVPQFDYDRFGELLETAGDRAGLTLCYAQKNLKLVGPQWQVVFGQFFSVDRTDYLISNRDVDQIFSKQKLPAAVVKPFRIYDEGEITPESKITFVKVTRDVCLYYRDLFVHKLGVTNAESYLLMLIDGKVVTAVGLNTQFLRQMKSTYIYEVFGISVTSKRYMRLGKLFMLVLTSRDMKAWLMSHYNFGIKEPEGIQTTSITTNEEGKTDRSVMKLTSRERLPDGRFKVIYRAEFRDEDWSETIARWARRWGVKERVK